MKKIILLISLLPLISLAQTTAIWDGEAGNKMWEDPLNWESDQVPGVDANVLITKKGSEVIIDSEVTVKSIQLAFQSTRFQSSFTITANGTLNLAVPSNFGLSINRAVKFKNNGIINVSRGGFNNLLYGAIDVKLANEFINNGEINIEYYTGLWGIHITDTPIDTLNGSINITYVAQFGIEIDAKFVNNADINMTDGLWGILLLQNFTNNGKITFERMNTGVRISQFGEFPLLNVINFKNTSAGQITHIGPGAYTFWDFERLHVINEGVMTMTDVSRPIRVKQFENDSVLNSTEYTEGINASFFKNNGAISLTEGIRTLFSYAFKGEFFENKGTIVVNNIATLFKEAEPYSGFTTPPLKQFRNYGILKASNLFNGILLDSVSLVNYENAKIEIDTIKYKAIKISGKDIRFDNRGEISVNFQTEADTAIVIGGDPFGNIGNSSTGVIKIKNVHNGMAVTIDGNSSSDKFYNFGKISIDSVSSPGTEAFGFLKASNTQFDNTGLLQVDNVDGYGFKIAAVSDGGVQISGEVRGKNNTISLFNNSQQGRFDLLRGGLIYSRGDTQYSILDSTQNRIFTHTCSRIDVVNIKKPFKMPFSEVEMNGLVKLTGKGSDFAPTLLRGLLIDVYGDIYPLATQSSFSTSDFSFGIGGGTSIGVKEMNFLQLNGDPSFENYSGFFLDSAMTVSAGTYNNTDGSFTPNFLTEQPKELYFTFNFTPSVASSACSYNSSIPIMGNTCPYDVTDNEFTGALDNDWHKPENWSQSVVPNVCHKAIIPANKRSVIETGRKARSAGIETFLGAVYDVAAGSVVDIAPAQ